MSRLPNISVVSSYVRSSGGSRIAGKVLLGASVISGVLSSFGAEKEIEFRKSQLKLPVYKLTEEQLVNPPWNHDNIDAWLYRRVEVVGRPIHRLGCYIPCFRFNQPGFMEIVPLVTREDKNHENRYGLLFNLGFIPEKVKSPTCRQKIQRVERQKYVGFVSRMDEFRNRSWFTGNAYQKGRLDYHNVDLQDLGKSSELLNQDQASVAIVERLYETGIYDERSSQRYGTDCHFTEEYPWAKTESGALQLHKMPWDHKNDAKHYFYGSIISLLVGASIF